MKENSEKNTRIFNGIRLEQGLRDKENIERVLSLLQRVSLKVLENVSSCMGESFFNRHWQEEWSFFNRHLFYEFGIYTVSPSVIQITGTGIEDAQICINPREEDDWYLNMLLYFLNPGNFSPEVNFDSEMEELSHYINSLSNNLDQMIG